MSTSMNACLMSYFNVSLFNLLGIPPTPTSGSAVSKKNSSRRNAWGNLSYADLITKAISSATDNRLTLSQIYEWMVQNVPYFKDKGDSNSSAGWKVSFFSLIDWKMLEKFDQLAEISEKAATTLKAEKQFEFYGKILYWNLKYSIRLDSILKNEFDISIKSLPKKIFDVLKSDFWRWKFEIYNLRISWEGWSSIIWIY